MKKNLLFAASIITALFTYLLFKTKKTELPGRPNFQDHPHPKKHLTQVFGNAKKHAMS